MPRLVSSPVSSHAYPFTTAVRSRSWDWLFELRRRLNVEVQLVDERANLALPQSSGTVAAPLSRLLSSDNLDLRTAIATAIRSRSPFSLVIDRFQLVCFGL